MKNDRHLKTYCATLALSAGLLISPALAAADEGVAPQSKTETHSRKTVTTTVTELRERTNLVDLASIKGMDARLAESGDKIGKIDGLLVDGSSGRIAYAVIAMDGDKMAAIPFAKLDMGDGKAVTVRATREQLDRIAFGKDATPDFNDRNYARDLHSNFATEPYWQTMGYMGGESMDGHGGMTDHNRDFSRRHSLSGWDNSYEFDSTIAPLTYTGEIVRTYTYRPAAGTSEGHGFVVRTEDGVERFVQAGPHAYWRINDLRMPMGERVQVIGTPTTLDGREEIRASELRRGNDRYTLYDSQVRRWAWQSEAFGARMAERAANSPRGTQTSETYSHSDSYSQQSYEENRNATMQNDGTESDRTNSEGVTQNRTDPNAQ